MSRRHSFCLGGFLACAIVGSLHAQGRPRNGVPAPSGGGSTVTQTGGEASVTIPPQLMHVRFTKAVTGARDIN